jgi:hypothetical protein
MRDDCRGSVWASSVKADALIALLSLPDDDGYTRSHRLTVEGRPDRFQLNPTLAAGFPTWRRVEREQETA